MSCSAWYDVLASTNRLVWWQDHPEGVVAVKFKMPEAAEKMRVVRCAGHRAHNEQTMHAVDAGDGWTMVFTATAKCRPL